MTHNELGGLTTASVHLQAYSSIDRKWVQPTPLQTLPTTVYSVASDTVDMGTKVSGPKILMLMGKSRVQRIAPNTYHGGGLYLLDVKPGVKPFFILKSVLVNGWVRRRLTTVEEWTVKDAPVRIVKLAQEAGEDMNRLWKDGRISKKSLTFGRAEEEPPTQVSVKHGIAEITRSLHDTSLRKESKKLKQQRISASDKIGETRAKLEGPEDWDPEEEVDVKATKSDDAKVECSKWNKEVIRTLGSPELSTLHPAESDQKDQRYVWTENGRNLYDEWWRQSYKEDRKEAEAAWDALSRLADTTWWEWKGGSRCMHWKWPSFYQSTIRDGLEGRFKYTPEAWTQPQRAGQNLKAHGLMKIKLKLV
ncbi:unnamed protein product [Cylindrotheca closterium]|uniref:Uncharacterized protein n=1 Tax=Cylindrotheca closterium TaxID=2856 RepID=A0AAD2GB15_9STRA|nr:unnamed protein product [Cylindrotheca closterium]